MKPLHNSSNTKSDDQSATKRPATAGINQGRKLAIEYASPAKVSQPTNYADEQEEWPNGERQQPRQQPRPTGKNDRPCHLPRQQGTAATAPLTSAHEKDGSAISANEANGSDDANTPSQKRGTTTGPVTYLGQTRDGSNYAQDLGHPPRSKRRRWNSLYPGLSLNQGGPVAVCRPHK